MRFFLDGQAPRARFFAGDELGKDGGEQGPAEVFAPNQRKPQRAPNLGIR
jgi:hypothetical protein